jgi:DHA1 family inner membrane transport protein
MTDTTMPARTAGSERIALWALLLGNFVTGLAVLLPAPMMTALAADLNVSIATAGLLITTGAVILCIGSPGVAWLTSRMDRRVLLTGTLVAIGLGHVVMALAPNFWVLLVTRGITLAAVAVFTPQAASAIGLFVPPERSARAISFIFIGWSIAVAGGMPLINYLANSFDWRVPTASLALTAFAGAALVWRSMPGRLFGAPLSFATWGEVARNGAVMMLLFITILYTTSQFVVLPFMEPVLHKMAGPGSLIVPASFVLFGVTGFIGNVIAARLVGVAGPLRTSLVFLGAMLIGLSTWAAGLGSLPAMFIGIAFWGIGFAAAQSMQQARLIMAAPQLASATVALNTSALYVGQAVGSAIGTALYVRELFPFAGYVSVVFMAAAIAAVIAFTRARA